MLSEWYYIQKDRRHGPVTEDAIRQLIRAGYLRPNDLIWRSGAPAWEQVSRFDELLADCYTVVGGGPVSPPPRPRSSSSRDDESRRVGSTIRPVYIFSGLAMLFVFGCCTFGVIGSVMRSREDAKNAAVAFEEADRLWDTGDHESASTKYTAISSSVHLTNAQRTKASERVSEHAREAAAREYLIASAEWDGGRKDKAALIFRKLVGRSPVMLPATDEQTARNRLEEFDAEQARIAAASNLKEADDAWEAGRRAEAVSLYRKLKDTTPSLVPDKALARVRSRVIEFETAQAKSDFADADTAWDAGRKGDAATVYRRLAQNRTLLELFSPQDRRTIASRLEEYTAEETVRTKAAAVKEATEARLKKLEASGRLEDNVRALIERELIKRKITVTITKFDLVRKGGNEYEGLIETDTGERQSVKVISDGKKFIVEFPADE